MSRSRTNRMSTELDEMVREIQKKFNENGINLSYTEASRILARKMREKREKRGIEFDFGF